VLTPVALVFAAWHLGRVGARRKVAISTGAGLILSAAADVHRLLHPVADG
jgi:hypothetical protein